MSTEDFENWKQEGQAVIKDIKEHVKDVRIAELLGCDNHKVHLNLTTLEGKTYCIEISANGFRVVGTVYDTLNIADNDYFETPYSLLSAISPQFHSSFGGALLSKLTALSENANN